MGKRRRRKKKELGLGGLGDVVDVDALIEQAFQLGRDIAHEAIGRMLQHNYPQMLQKRIQSVDEESEQVIQVSPGVDYIPPRKAGPRGK